jgi:hypothetical protein
VATGSAYWRRGGGVLVAILPCLWAHAGEAPASDTTPLIIALCPGGAAPEQALYRHEFFGNGGSQQELLVLRTMAPADCRQTRVAAPEDARVQWAGLPAARDVTDRMYTLLLQGRFADRARVSEIIIPGAAAATAPERWLPMDADALPAFTLRSFGGGRASVDEELRLRCTTGDGVAGVFLESGRQWPGNVPLKLQVTATGTGRFGLAIGDAGRNARQDPLELGFLDVDAGPQTATFDVPFNLSRPWNSLTVLCPAGGGELQVLAVRAALPQPTQDGPLPYRTAWLWDPRVWRERADWIWSLQQERRLAGIYITVPVGSDGAVEQAAGLTSFLREAARHELQVWAVIGDRHDVLPATREALQMRLRAYLQFNRGSEADARLAGVQLDIEPYLLPGFALAQAGWRDQYVSVVATAQHLLGNELKLELVMPYWWGTHGDWGAALFDQLQPGNLSVTVMDYRTDSAQLRAGAEPFLIWGQGAGVPVRIALETGRIADEQRRRYGLNGNEGEVWLLDVEGQPVLLLFDTAQPGAPGRAYRMQQESTVSGAATSFAGHASELTAAIRELEPEWARWPSFSGLALHGLDETAPREPVPP